MYNPFSPAYGVTPSAIFGREQILRRFDAAMLTQGSPDRAIYVTGMHASGKTTLLKLLAKRTRFRGRFVISLGPDYPEFPCVILTTYTVSVIPKTI